ncbi:MAG: hypothetical protein EBQ87_11930 [Planctomycetes bacterium]|nr:hypothetical protein [Planctomycetota bacterium]
MLTLRTIFVAKLFFLFCAVLQAADGDVVLTPWFPRNLPDGMQFSGAVGSRFRITALVKDAVIDPGSAFDFEVDIQALGKVVSPPHDLDFESMFAGNASFKVEVLPGLTQSEARRWRYFCRLWPLKEGRLVIPEIPFPYINPDIPWSKKQLMLEFSDSIEVGVLQRKIFAVSLRGPDVVFDVDELRKSPWLGSVKGVGFTEFIWLFFTPPFVGIAIWSIAKYRASLALLNGRGRALWVLENLAGLKNETYSVQAEGVFELMQEYFHQSFRLSGLVTSTEIVNGLFAKFLNQEETERFSEYIGEVETAKFNPGLPKKQSDIIGQAIAWIGVLEVRR